MDQQVADALWKRVDQEPFARKLGLKLVKLEPGYALVEMTLQPDTANIFETAHGTQTRIRVPPASALRWLRERGFRQMLRQSPPWEPSDPNGASAPASVVAIEKGARTLTSHRRSAMQSG